MPETTAEGQRGACDVAKFVLGRDLSGADHLDAIPGHPVRRLAPQPLDPEALVEAGGLMDRARRAQVGELVGPPGLGRHPDSYRPSSSWRTVGSSSGRGQTPGAGPAIAPRRSGASRSPRRSSRATPGDRRSRRRSPGDTGATSSGMTGVNSHVLVSSPSGHQSLSVAFRWPFSPSRARRFRNRSATRTEKPGSTSPPSEHARPSAG